MENKNENSAILAVYDISGIQEYIFGSSRMEENTGASLLISKILDKQLKEVFEMLNNKYRKKAFKTEQSRTFQMNEDKELLAEVVYSGGGNGVAVFRNQKVYNEVSRELAKRLLETSYTLVLTTAFVTTDFTNYSADKERLDQKLEEEKDRIQRQRPMGALPIVEQEGGSGFPIAVRTGGQNLSILQALKRQEAGVKKGDMSHYFGISLPEGVEFATQMADMTIGDGENGYVAVIHIDGNSMGKTIRKRVKEFQDYEKGVPGMRMLSRGISECYREVFQEMLNVVAEKREALSMQWRKREGKEILPVRPLILGGDDVTFLCNVKWGVALAALFLRLLSQKEKKPLEPMSACAGIALVHSHFPFNIAYEIAEECCGNAKKKCAGRKEGGSRESCLDFHLVRGAYVREMEERRRDLSGFMGRPYLVCREGENGGGEAFADLDQTIRRLNEVNPDSGERKWPRSRLKRLYEACQEGPEQMELVKKEFVSRGYEVKELIRNGGERVLFDALELMDLYEEGLPVTGTWKREGE